MQISTLSIDNKGLNGAGGAVHEPPPPSAGSDEPAKGPSASAPDPDLAKKLGDFRQHLQASFAKVIITMMTTPRYKHCSLTELERLVLDPLLRNRVAIAEAKPRESAASSQEDAPWESPSGPRFHPRSTPRFASRSDQKCFRSG
jgi:hypothetical protein